MSRLDPAVATVVAIAIGYAMTVAGVAKKRLVWRTGRCGVCGRPRPLCTCYWR